MNRTIPLLAVAAMALGGCNMFGRDHDSGPHAARDFPVGAFSKLAVTGSYDVEVRTGAAPSVHAEGGQNRLDKLEVKVAGDTLTIGSTKGIRWSWGGKHETVKIIVTVPALTAADMAGSGDIRIDHVTGPTFKGSVTGSGDLNLAKVDAASLELGIAGSGDIKAAGATPQAKYDLAGSGDIDASAVTAQAAAISISGSGTIRAHATGTAAVNLVGSGDITVTGGGKCTINKTGSGDIRCS